MKCLNSDEILRFLDRKLSAQKEKEFIQHLSVCTTCRDEVLPALRTDILLLKASLGKASQESKKSEEFKRKVFSEIKEWRLADEKESIKKLYGKFIRQVCPILTRQLNNIFNRFYLTVQENKSLSGAYSGPFSKDEMVSLLKTGKVSIKKDKHKELSRYDEIILENIREVVANSGLPANQKLLAEKHINNITKRQARKKK